MTFVAGDNVHDYLKNRAGVSRRASRCAMAQEGALEQSKCFASSNMTCSTCHNVHEKQENAGFVFSRHCMTCREIQACGRYRALGQSIRDERCSCGMSHAARRSLRRSLPIRADACCTLLRAHQIGDLLLMHRSVWNAALHGNEYVSVVQAVLSTVGRGISSGLKGYEAACSMCDTIANVPSAVTNG